MCKRDRVLALAGVFQATSLVSSLATTGKMDQQSFATCINSLFELNPDNLEKIYGAPDTLTLGLKELITSMKSAKHRDVVRYALSLIHLERKLINNKEMLETIKAGITRANKQAEIFEPTHDNVIANLAGIYTDTISNFNFKIHVVGKQELLLNTELFNKIRALLLSGMRSAILWRQLGGSRLQLVFQRRKLITIANELLQ